MSAYEARRIENIKRNQALIAELGIQRTKDNKQQLTAEPPSKKRKISTITARPTRASARIASAPSKPIYNDDDTKLNSSTAGKATSSRPKARPRPATSADGAVTSPEPTLSPPEDLERIRAGWTAWTATEAPPTRDAHGTYHFASHPHFTPNKSPSELLHEGVFGGSYYRPLHSRTLATTIHPDWEELPPSWLTSLNPATHLTRTEYEPNVNKYGVKCGQSIEEWEAAGWIAVEHDVRGWFQWYTRFWRGRRCEDDERQVGRWTRCVGPRGRWRRTLLKRYLQAGVRSVADEGADEEEVSPVLHQTCLHWAFELRQEELDRVWEEGL